MAYAMTAPNTAMERIVLPNAASAPPVKNMVNKIKKPTREEFREKVTEYFKMLDPLVNVYDQNENFGEIIDYLKKRNAIELEKISAGKNPEVEKRYDRYIDYG